MPDTLTLPRHFTGPNHIPDTSVAELADLAGLAIDRWQDHALSVGCGRLVDGSFASRSVGILAGRQQGKTEIAVARVLAGMFLAADQRVVYLAHQRVTAYETFSRILSAIERTPVLQARVRRVIRTLGRERIELHNGSVLSVLSTGTRGGGRGMVADLIVCDDAHTLSDDLAESLGIMTAAAPNPQTWLLGGAVDDQLHPRSFPFTRMRRAATGLPRPASSLTWIEYSADDTRDANGNLVVDVDDPDVIAHANPAGARLVDSFARDRVMLAEQYFVNERLAIGRWPRLPEVATVDG